MDKVAVGIKNNINVLLNFGGFINHDECAHGQAITLAANNQRELVSFSLHHAQIFNRHSQ